MVARWWGHCEAGLVGLERHGCVVRLTVGRRYGTNKYVYSAVVTPSLDAFNQQLGFNYFRY